MSINLLLGLLILVIFGLGAWSMIRRYLPALLTLPIMALAMVIVAALITQKIAVSDITNGVIKGGSLLLAEAIMTAFFGGILSFIMQKSGVAESLVKNGAELIGDNPFGVAVFSMALIALLFTSIGGLGAVIMVAMVVLPMLSTVGIQPVVAGGIMLIGISLGGSLNAGNWVLFKDTLGVPIEQIKGFALIVFFLMGLTGILFITIELYRGGVMRSLRKTLTIIGGVAAVGGIAIYIIITRAINNSQNLAETEATGTPGWRIAMMIIVGIFFLWIIGSAIWDILKRVERWRHQTVTIKWYAYLIPVFPLVLILVYNVTPLAAFFCGFLYAILVTMRPGSASLTVQSMIQGSSAVLPAALLMITIGILINAVKGPNGWSEANGGAQWPIIEAIQPFFSFIPSNPIGYVLVFGIAAPLALYRGPFNTYGLGFGIATVLVTAAGLPEVAVMGMLLTVGQIQGVSDPTNTVNVWLANELRVDVQSLMWRTLPYVWGMVFVGLSLSAIVFLGGGEKPSPPSDPAALIETTDAITTPTLTLQEATTDAIPAITEEVTE